MHNDHYIAGVLISIHSPTPYIIIAFHSTTPFPMRTPYFWRARKAISKQLSANSMPTTQHGKERVFSFPTSVTACCLLPLVAFVRLCLAIRVIIVTIIYNVLSFVQTCPPRELHRCAIIVRAICCSFNDLCHFVLLKIHKMLLSLFVWPTPCLLLLLRHIFVVVVVILILLCVKMKSLWQKKKKKNYRALYMLVHRFIVTIFSIRCGFLYLHSYALDFYSFISLYKTCSHISLVYQLRKVY